VGPTGRLRRRCEHNIKRIIKIQDVKVWSGSLWLWIKSVAVSYEHGNETSSSINGREFLD